jgi:hypothetical protein
MRPGKNDDLDENKQLRQQEGSMSVKQPNEAVGAVAIWPQKESCAQRRASSDISAAEGQAVT